MRRTVLLVAALMAMGSPAAAAPARPAPEGVIVEALVVTAARKSPPWWKVSNGESVVRIMGAPMGPLPKDLTWDRHVLEERLTGAKAVILPSGATIGIGDLFGLFRLRGKVREDQGLEPSLPPDLRARFVAARTALGKDEGRYAHWNPVVAGALLQNDFVDRWDLRSGGLVTREARALARKHGVPAQRTLHKAMPVLRSAVDEMKDEERAQACLAGALEAVEVDPARFRAAAEAWSVGRLREAIDLPRGGDVCRELIYGEFAQTTIDEQAAAISEALQTPGAAVAIVPLRQLLVKNGVLEQLKAKGYEIVDPSKPDE
jgi:hypothetical protein